MVANVEVPVTNDRRMALQEEGVANQCSIGEASADQILHELIIDMRKVSARWLPKQLTEKQKESRMDSKRTFGMF